jgi:hypothetical protein
LLPRTLDSSVRVLTPGVFVRKGCWGLRRLVPREVLLAKDVSEDSLKNFVDPSDSLLRLLLPGKSWVAGFKALTGGVWW